MAPFAAGVLAVVVSSEVPCPSAAELDARLNALLPAPSAAALTATHRVHLAPGPGGAVSVTLFAGDVALVTRTLPGGGACAELADGVAALIGSWETQLGSSMGSRRIVTAAAEPAPPIETGSPVTVALAAAAGLSASAGAPVVPELSGELALGKRDRASGWALGGRVQGEATQSLGAGEVAWRRADGFVAATLRHHGKHFLAEADLAAAAELLWIGGRGFQANAASVRLVPAITLGGRVGWAAGRVAPWLGVAVDVWPLRTEARLRDASDTRVLPRAAVRLSLGLTFALKR